jgi:hypothetical protein
MNLIIGLAIFIIGYYTGVFHNNLMREKRRQEKSQQDEWNNILRETVNKMGGIS